MPDKLYADLTRFKLTIVLTVLFAVIQHVITEDIDNIRGNTALRPRLGHFSEYKSSDPFFPIFEQYFEKVIKMQVSDMKTVSASDWRNVRPTGDFCVGFLTSFQVENYVISKPFDIIPLDACLGWLYAKDDQYKPFDVEILTKNEKSYLKSLENDPILKQTYTSTKFIGPQLPESLMRQLYDYIIELLKINYDNPKSGCHGLWLEAYLNFLEDVYIKDCEDETNCVFYDYPGHENDSYLKLIAESTILASQTCYEVMQHQMRNLIEAEYENSNSGQNNLAKRLRSKPNRVLMQSKEKKWSREMIGVLQMASGVDSDQPVNLGDVVTELNRITSEDKPSMDRLTNGLSEYALQNVNLKDSDNDPKGFKRFEKAKAKLCGLYMDSTLIPRDNERDTGTEDEKKPFEYYNLIYSLVKITNHEPIFHISKHKFEEEMLENNWEPLYLAAYTCQVISATWGELSFVTNSEAFKVKFRPNFNIMIQDWPLNLLTERLPFIYPKSTMEPSYTPATPEHPSSSESKHHGSSPVFGKKLKFLMKTSVDKIHDQGATSPRSRGPQAHQQEMAPASSPASPLGQAPAPAPVQPPAPTPAPAPAPATIPTPAPAPVKVSAPFPIPVRSIRVSTPPPEPANRQYISLDTIYKFRDLHGRYPSLPPDIRKIYPELPEDLTKTYPKKILGPQVRSGQGNLHKQTPVREIPPRSPPRASATSLGNSGGWQPYSGPRSPDRSTKSTKQDAWANLDI